MEYNQDLYRKFRALAIVNTSDLIIGQTYYTHGGGSFVFRGFQTNKEHYKSNGLDWKNKKTAHLLGWMVTDKGCKSLHDNNIGASYNPWLIFDNEDLAKAYSQMLIITWPSYDND